jgi:hypothetical protein
MAADWERLDKPDISAGGEPQTHIHGIGQPLRQSLAPLHRLGTILQNQHRRAIILQRTATAPLTPSAASKRGGTLMAGTRSPLNPTCGPVGRMPTLSPRSEARGRALGVVFWATAKAVANKTVATAKDLLAMGIGYDQIPVSCHRLSQKSTLAFYFCFRPSRDFRIGWGPESQPVGPSGFSTGKSTSRTSSSINLSAFVGTNPTDEPMTSGLHVTWNNPETRHHQWQSNSGA